MSYLRWALPGLLALLAACSEPEPPPPEPPQDITPVPTLDAAAQRQADAAYYNQLRARWLELEHAERSSPEPETEQPVVAVPPAEKKPPVPAAPVPSGATPALAIVIDDVGHNLHHGRRLLALPAPVTLAILPHTQAAQRLAEEAAAQGRSVILHQPMENGAGLSIGPGGLYNGMQPDELRQVLQNNLDSFAPILGLNNHMGSRLTAERQAMDEVMQVLRERNLFFIDSRTTHHTQAAFAAEAAGVPHLSRDVFLDNDRDPAAIARAFSRALEVARREGRALLIGHPYPQTLEFLEWRLAGDLLAEEGVEVVDVVELLGRE